MRVVTIYYITCLCRMWGYSVILCPCSGLERDVVHVEPGPDAVLSAHGSRLVPLFLSVGLQSILPPLPQKLPSWPHLILQTLLCQDSEQKKPLRNSDH